MAREIIKLVSEAGTGYYYTTKVNKRTIEGKLRRRKYDPVTRKHEWFKQVDKLK